MQTAMERLRDAMEAEGIVAIRRVVFAGKTVGFKVELENGSEGAGLSPRAAISNATGLKVAA